MINIKNFISSFLLIAVLSVAAYAQQLPQYSQYMINNYVLNPAITGSNTFFEAKSNNRYQWQGITDAPRTYILSAHGPLRSKNVGLGAFIFSDVTGPTRRVGGYFSYAYHLNLTEKLKLGMGLSAGILQFTVDGAQITLRDEGDFTLYNSLDAVVIPDIGFGFYLYSNDFYIGASAPQITQSRLKLFNTTTQMLNKLEDHYFLNGGYKFVLNDEVDIEPSFLLKYMPPTPLQLDIGSKVSYKQKYWIGFSYRTHDAISALLGFLYQDYLLFAYAYDFTTSGLKSYSNGTHEIMIGLRFIKKREPGI